MTQTEPGVKKIEQWWDCAKDNFYVNLFFLLHVWTTQTTLVPAFLNHARFGKYKQGLWQLTSMNSGTGTSARISNYISHWTQIDLQSEMRLHLYWLSYTTWISGVYNTHLLQKWHLILLWAANWDNYHCWVVSSHPNISNGSSLQNPPALTSSCQWPQTGGISLISRKLWLSPSAPSFLHRWDGKVSRRVEPVTGRQQVSGNLLLTLCNFYSRCCISLLPYPPNSVPRISLFRNGANTQKPGSFQNISSSLSCDLFLCSSRPCINWHTIISLWLKIMYKTGKHQSLILLAPLTSTKTHVTNALSLVHKPTQLPWASRQTSELKCSFCKPKVATDEIE